MGAAGLALVATAAAAGTRPEADVVAAVLVVERGALDDLEALRVRVREVLRPDGTPCEVRLALRLTEDAPHQVEVWGRCAAEAPR